MKKNDWLLFAAVGLYSFLFYQQTLGINFLIFTLFLVTALSVSNTHLLKNKPWLIAAFGSLVSAGCIACYGNGLSFTANFISLSLLSALSCNPRTSVVFSLIASFYSYLTAIVFIVLDYIEKKKARVISPENTLVSKAWLIGVPVLVAGVFFFMYRAANPLFYNLTRELTFNFISWGWVMFTLGGLVLLYGFFYHRPIAELTFIDAYASDYLYSSEEKPLYFLGKKWSLAQEVFTGTVLLLLLNGLLLFVNGLDFTFLYLSQDLPEGMTYSESVHQGIGMLITSIIVAIAVILFFFRGELNFNNQNKNLKLLAYIWILQNAFMLISTAYRNYFYIQEYSLTYKRIGVFVYLLLVLAGLLTTAIKIARVKSNWYLFRQNAWVAYAVLVLACLVNWDLLITRFNITQSYQHHKQLDQEYLLELSETNLPELVSLQNEPAIFPEAPDESGVAHPKLINLEYPTDSVFYFKSQVHRELVNYLLETDQADWQSWNWDQHRIWNNLTALEKSGTIPELYLSNQNHKQLPFTVYFPGLHTLNLRKNELDNLTGLQNLPELQNLDLSYNKLSTINSLPALPKLKVLNLSENEFSNLEALNRLPALEKLDLEKTQVYNLNTLPIFPNLTYLNLSNTNITDYQALQKYPKLKFLLLRNSLHQGASSIPALSSVRWLDISGNTLSNQNQVAFKNLARLSQVTHLDLSFNNLKSLTFENEKVTQKSSKVTTPPKPATIVPEPLLAYKHLESLNLFNNKIKSLATIQSYPSLQELYLGMNKIQSLEPLAGLPNLQVLNLEQNQLTRIDILAKTTTLKELNLFGNTIYLDKQVFNQLFRLQKLDVSKNRLNDINALSDCISLSYLDISQNHITSLNGCRQLKNLQYLLINDNPVQDYSALYKLKNLKVLVVDKAISEADYQALTQALPGTQIRRANTYATEAIASTYEQ